MRIEQRKRLRIIIENAREIHRELGDLQQREGHRVHFRPSASGVTMVGLNPHTPQLGKGKFKNLPTLRADFEDLYEKHCIDVSPGRSTPEGELQSYLVSEAFKGNRVLKPLIEGSAHWEAEDSLLFITDEIHLPRVDKKDVKCDILALKRSPSGLVPVVIELKFAREMKRLIEQLNSYAALVDEHVDLFAQLYSALTGIEVNALGACEKWAVWPGSLDSPDRREEVFHAAGIRLITYAAREDGFDFRLGAPVGAPRAL